jgi:2-dehydropantoate 2-reductase
MVEKYRVAILGLGGVGAFIGGKLAAFYSGTDTTEIIFISRGANEHAIRENGLQLVTNNGEQTVQPHLLTHDATTVGKIDLLICATKAYHLQESLLPLAGCIDSGTIILPLLNGVDNSEKIKALFPLASVLEGCIYIVSKLVAPGIVKQSGDFYSLHFGSNEAATDRLDEVYNVFNDAGINATLEADMNLKLWSKFSFISPIATYTSAFNISIGRILQEEEHSTRLRGLMTELMELASHSGIQLPANTLEKNFEVMARLPYETTSSMQADFATGRNTELETLTGYVVEKARANDLNLSNYEALYNKLRQ